MPINESIVLTIACSRLTQTMGLIKSAIFFALIAVAVYYVRSDLPRQCVGRSGGACLFSESYDHARLRFLEKARLLNASFVSLEVSQGYTIDIAVFNEEFKKERVLIVTSATHGVEGFAGSAIQLNMMESGEMPQDVCVVLVHALNPFGYAELRRWNENNVDLNRNALFNDKDWIEIRKRDPNIDNYEDILDFVVPTGPPNLLVNFFHSVRLLATYGFNALKRALVSGTYTRETGLFYGGQNLQKSHILLKSFFETRGIFATKKAFLIDVHTGLGPKGADSIMTENKNSFDAISKVLKLEIVPPPYSVLFTDKSDGASNTGASAGYENVRGFFDNYRLLFKHEAYSATQEFGTYPGLLVAMALAAENQAYHFQRNERHFYSHLVREMFNPTSQYYREQVVLRGANFVKIAQKALNE